MRDMPPGKQEGEGDRARGRTRQGLKEEEMERGRAGCSPGVSLEWGF